MTARTTAFVSHSDCSLHDPGWGHPEHQGRLPGVARAVYRDMLTLFEPLRELEGRPATDDDLRLAHSPEYVRRVRAAAEEAAAAGRSLPFEGEVVVSGASWDASLAAVGCALTAVEAVLAGNVANAFCAVRPPGHRAGVERAGGFGLFNPTAIAALHLRRRRGIGRVMILDLGGPPGSGTAEIVAPDPGIRFLSVHQESVGTPGGLPDPTHSVAVPPGATGEPVLEALAAALDAASADFPPDFLLVSLGFDALSADPLGALALEPVDYHPITRLLQERAEALCCGRLVCVMEGGYDAAATGLAVVQHLRALAGLPPA